jgi:hypothetical protein
MGWRVSPLWTDTLEIAQTLQSHLRCKAGHLVLVLEEGWQRTTER